MLVHNPLVVDNWEHHMQVAARCHNSLLVEDCRSSQQGVEGSRQEKAVVGFPRVDPTWVVDPGQRLACGNAVRQHA